MDDTLLKKATMKFQRKFSSPVTVASSKLLHFLTKMKTKAKNWEPLEMRFVDLEYVSFVIQV